MGCPSSSHPLMVPLPRQVKNAHYIGITLWLTQSRVWNGGSSDIRTVEQEDVKATAWFDDVVVLPITDLPEPPEIEGIELRACTAAEHSTAAVPRAFFAEILRRIERLRARPPPLPA